MMFYTKDNQKYMHYELKSPIDYSNKFTLDYRIETIENSTDIHKPGYVLTCTGVDENGRLESASINVVIDSKTGMITHCFSHDFGGSYGTIFERVD
jgi:hypothetical protein